MIIEESNNHRKVDKMSLDTPSKIEYKEFKQSANTLFKFMKEIDYLKMVLKDSAIIPRYNTEKIDYLNIPMFEEIAFPMVCFCDINLTKLNLHTENYGSYGIGLKKEAIYKKIDIEPIHYVRSNSNELIDFKKAFNTSLKPIEEELVPLSNYLSTSLLYMKPIFGTDNEEKICCFHDEREWRYIPKVDESELNMVLFGNNLTTHYKDLSTKAMENNPKYWLKIEPEDINYILIENEDEIIELSNYINGLDRYSEEERLNMISKILILNNLGKDW